MQVKTKAHTWVYNEEDYEKDVSLLLRCSLLSLVAVNILCLALGSGVAGFVTFAGVTGLVTLLLGCSVAALYMRLPRLASRRGVMRFYGMMCATMLILFMLDTWLHELSHVAAASLLGLEARIADWGLVPFPAPEAIIVSGTEGSMAGVSAAGVLVAASGVIGPTVLWALLLFTLPRYIGGTASPKLEERPRLQASRFVYLSLILLQPFDLISDLVAVTDQDIMTLRLLVSCAYILFFIIIAKKLVGRTAF